MFWVWRNVQKKPDRSRQFHPRRVGPPKCHNRYLHHHRNSGAGRQGGTGTVPSFVIPVIFVSYPDTGNSQEQPGNREYLPLSYTWFIGESRCMVQGMWWESISSFQMICRVQSSVRSIRIKMPKTIQIQRKLSGAKRQSIQRTRNRLTAEGCMHNEHEKI